MIDSLFFFFWGGGGVELMDLNLHLTIKSFVRVMLQSQ